MRRRREIKKVLSEKSSTSTEQLHESSIGRLSPGWSALKIPAEKAGFVPSREGLKTRFKRVWDRGQMFPLVIGQGSNIMTPVQAATMIARTAANDAGLSLHLVHSPAKTPKTLLSPKVEGLVKEGLGQVVRGAFGTGKALRGLPFKVSGKTGTAQASGGKGDHAWFVAYAPAEKPEIAVAVLLEHGGHGGAVAAPIAGDFLEKYFEHYPMAR